MTKIKQLLSITPYFMSGEELYQVGESFKQNSHFSMFERLPEFSVNEDGLIVISENWHQWTTQTPDQGDKKEFYLFDFKYASGWLNEEISNCGLGFLFKDFNFKKFFEKLPKEYFNNFGEISIHKDLTIIVDYIINGHYEDMEIEVEVVGYLDDKFSIVNI